MLYREELVYETCFCFSECINDNNKHNDYVFCIMTEKYISWLVI